jgi:ADP-heptose:LPS heptosyltransferase
LIRALTKSLQTFDTYGCTGDKKKICLILKHCGLGDHIQSLPAIYQLVARGYDITIYTDEFMFPIYEKLPIELIDIREHYAGFSKLNADKFGNIYSLEEWGIDLDRGYGFFDNEIDRVTLFSFYFGLNRPRSFEWECLFDLKKEESDYIIYAPQSAEKARTLFNEFATYFELKKKFKNVIWLGHPETKDRKVMPDFNSLANLIYNAKAVLCPDSGIMNLAMSLGVPTMALFGSTNEDVVCEPYQFYLPNAKRLVLRTHKKQEAEFYGDYTKGFLPKEVAEQFATFIGE